MDQEPACSPALYRIAAAFAVLAIVLELTDAQSLSPSRSPTQQPTTKTTEPRRRSALGFAIAILIIVLIASGCCCCCFRKRINIMYQTWRNPNFIVPIDGQPPPPPHYEINMYPQQHMYPVPTTAEVIPMAQVNTAGGGGVYVAAASAVPIAGVGMRYGPDGKPITSGAPPFQPQWQPPQVPPPQQQQGYV